MTIPAKEQITLNFKGDDVHLFELLREEARKNRRTLTAEILCRVEKTFSADFRGHDDHGSIFNHQ